MRALLLPLLLAACATPERRDTPPDLRGEVIRSATGLIGQRQLTLKGNLLPADCFALPRAAFGEHGIELGANTALGLYRKLQREGHTFAGTPQRGDLVFLRDVGRENAVHVGLVGRVDHDGTVTVYQRMAHGVEAYRMNPAHPHDGSGDDHHPWNDSIAAGNGDTAPAGALFAAYGSVLP
jgi:hypothetical protein